MRGVSSIITGKRISILLFLLPFLSYAQFYQGLDVGLNNTSADFSFYGSESAGSAEGFRIGYVFERDITDLLYVRLGATFNRRSFKVNTVQGITVYNEKWSSDAFEIPVNLGYYINWNVRRFQVFIDAGVNFAYINKASIKNEDETIYLDIGNEADINRIALGANGSIGLLIKKRVKVRLNYYYGLSNMFTTEDIWKNRTLGITINYFVREKEVY